MHPPAVRHQRNARVYFHAALNKVGNRNRVRERTVASTGAGNESALDFASTDDRTRPVARQWR